MTHRTGPIETALRLAVQGYVQRHGYGSQTPLAKTIKRSSAWIGLFIAGERRVGVDEALLIADALELDLSSLLAARHPVDTSAIDLRPVDRREMTLQRLFIRLQHDASRDVVVDTARSLVRMEEQQRKV
jgi:hypothetical protein